MSGRQIIEHETRRQMIKVQKEAARREKRKLKELKKLLYDQDYQLLSSTEFMGLLGDIIPYNHPDWKTLQEAQLLVRSLGRSNTKKEIQSFLDKMDALLTDACARSSSKDVIDYLFGEPKRGEETPSYSYTRPTEE